MLLYYLTTFGDKTCVVFGVGINIGHIQKRPFYSFFLQSAENSLDYSESYAEKAEE
jgi:hypothetical protein